MGLSCHKIYLQAWRMASIAATRSDFENIAVPTTRVSAPYETTIGVYGIGNKEKDPVWHKPGFGPIPAGDPGNELGTRWMPMVPVEEGLPTDLGIHGALDPNTVGKYSSHGCARLRMPEVEELYDYIVRSTPVSVVDVVPEDLRA